MRNNPHITKASVLVTTHEARRSGFLEYALRRNKESIPFIDKAKALRACLIKHTKSCKDVLIMEAIQDSLMEAAGISVKAKAHLVEADKRKLLSDFVDNVLVPCGEKYIDEIVYRYLLTLGDALGGKMRNITGSIAGEKFSRFIIAQLSIRKLAFEVRVKDSAWLQHDQVTASIKEHLKAIRWNNGSEERSIIYNINVPQVSKNIDIVMLKSHLEDVSPRALRAMLTNAQSVRAIGELKGGIDPAGADEHWKTANTALGRVRKAFGNQLSLFFVGAAIENAMADEIYKQCTSGHLSNAANLTNDNQLASLCDWLINQ